MTPDPKALAVLLDAARAAYGDDTDVVRWLEHPDAVWELLGHLPTLVAEDGDEVCPRCGEGGNARHAPECAVFRAWAALELRMGQVSVGNAFDRARPARPMWSELTPEEQRSLYGIYPADVERGVATRDLAAGEVATVRLDAEGLRIAAGTGRVTLRGNECGHSMLGEVTISAGDTHVARCINCDTLVPVSAGRAT